MINLDLIVFGTVARLILGVFVGAVSGFVGWLVALWVFQIVPFTNFTFPLVSVLAIGMLVSTGVTLSWWNWETPWRIKLLSAALVIAAVLLSNWLTYLATTNTRYYTWIEGGVVFPMINIAVLIANVVAGAVFLFRTTRHREV